MIYGFCSSNVLYSASLSFKIFIFLIVPSDTWDCNFFKSNLSLLIYIKVLLVKHITLFCSPRNINKQLFSSVYFCVYPVFLRGGVVKKMFSGKRCWEKRYIGSSCVCVCGGEGGDSHSHIGGLSIEEGLQLPVHYDVSVSWRLAVNKFLCYWKNTLKIRTKTQVWDNVYGVKISLIIYLELININNFLGFFIQKQNQ